MLRGFKWSLRKEQMCIAISHIIFNWENDSISQKLLVEKASCRDLYKYLKNCYGDNFVAKSLAVETSDTIGT